MFIETHLIASGKSAEDDILNAAIFLLFVDHGNGAKDFVTLPGKLHQIRNRICKVSAAGYFYRPVTFLCSVQ